MDQRIGFCQTEDGTRIAYAVAGKGYPLVRVLGWGSHVEYDLTAPVWSPMLAPLAEHFQLILYDGRGTGLSDRNVEKHTPEQWIADLDAVVQAVGLDRFALLGISQGGPTAIEYATLHPDRVSHLVLYGSFAKMTVEPEIANSLITMTRAAWGKNNPAYRQMFIGMFVPGASEELAKVFDDLQREAMNSEDAAKLLEAVRDIDVRELLPKVQSPTLVVHRRGDQAVLLEGGHQLASGIPNARFMPLDGRNHLFLREEPEAIAAFVDAVREFVTPSKNDEPSAGPSSFRTVLFTDLVDHTQMMQRLGDHKGRELLREHERVTRETLKANGGTEVKTMGDGFMASFTSVQKAVECAIALQRAFDEHNHSANEKISVRVGLNAGEPIEEDGDLFGATVILASRIAAKAGGGEILVADTVRGLCSGKGFLFADRGDFVAKGFEEPVKVYEVSWAT